MSIRQQQLIRPEAGRSRASVVVRVALLGAAIGALWFREPLIDAYTLATYHPTANVAAIEAKLGLTRQARAIFYRADPQIDSKSAFNRDCSTQKGELELGCYVNGRIYVLQIDNVSLQPEMTTVMAHELLHAAWARETESEHSSLGGQLETLYHGLGNADLGARMADYAKTEPGQETNELHSILGTEQPTLAPELDAYYARYFTNRTAIAAAHGAYEAVFNSRRDALGRELATVKALKGQLATLNARMEADKRAGAISAYNGLVPSQNALVDRINAMIGDYNTGVEEFNALSKSLDSQELGTESGV